MTMTETIVWHPASEPPSDDRVVLITDADDVTERGYWNGDKWFNDEGYFICAVTHWSDLPRGPAAEGGAK